MSKAIAQLSADAGILIAELSKRDIGTTITYEQIAGIIGWDIRKNRGLMHTVKNRLLRDHGKILDVVRDEGYRVLTDSEAVEGKLRSDRERRRRSAKRSKAVAGAVNISKLSETQRIAYLAEVTAAHVTIEASSDKTVKQLSAAVNGHNTPLALNNALDAIKKNV